MKTTQTRAATGAMRLDKTIDIAARIPAEYREEWEREGWSVFTTTKNGIMEIERDDDTMKFDNDEAALHHVIAMASGGSRSHLFALWLDGRPAEVEWSELAWIPDELLPEKEWTVVGYYDSSRQPWIEHVEAENATQAAVKAIKENSVRSDDIIVIDAFRGHHSGMFLPKTVARGDIVLGAYDLGAPDAKGGDEEA